MRVPTGSYGAPRVSFDEPFMQLHEAVAWVAYRGGERPLWGGHQSEGDVWTDHGDRPEEDQRTANEASEVVRDALVRGELQAIGRRSSGSPENIPPGAWVKQFGMTVSDQSFRADAFLSVIVPDARVRQLWPAPGSDQGKPARGRPSIKGTTVEMGRKVAADLGSGAPGVEIVNKTITQLEKEGSPTLTARGTREALVEAGVIPKGR